MMGVFSAVASRAGIKEPTTQPNDRTQEEHDEASDEEVLDEEPKHMLLALISQLRVGMDLHKVTLPTFVLEPRSMLERITDFLSHPDLIFGVSQQEDPTERFIQVLRYYLAGWHIKPKGVKKPYNPILGEFFRCRYEYPDGSEGFYIAEQVSHHPPISAFYYVSPTNQIEIWGDLRPKSKFLGNSAATIMEGVSHLRFVDREEDGHYQITMPNMYARGILFGKMILELGDESRVQTAANDIYCDVEFKTKGFFGGDYNAIGGKVRDQSGIVGEISGKWNEVMELKRTKGKTETIFDASKATVTQKIVQPEAEQDWNESRRLWSKVTRAIKKKDLDAATLAKTQIEDFQRDRARLREEKELKWEPVFFECRDDEEWKPKFTLPEDKQERIKAVEKYIFDYHSTAPIDNPTDQAASSSLPSTVSPSQSTFPKADRRSSTTSTPTTSTAESGQRASPVAHKSLDSSG
ncbi:hypothetical protein PGTUg99_018791 [Puccinia graminis f. sp. tritici]|uniref:Oxysterol-binding protein n=1 Tax=Puccinia graminis f. sp. tritici TaxID=56615 RepID=A0A5B0MD78_PUCGR|nr:hypothetical protein PGTUg99_018791 [Puccinia graminis f. sp. tritici]